MFKNLLFQPEQQSNHSQVDGHLLEKHYQEHYLNDLENVKCKHLIHSFTVDQH